ncbi:MAG: zf-HC2 domain-containing protein [Candidatus Omnitrophica bacterium]|nr:zf-HC2 domain-containing protein [Candidatus Omnitrophota bacterium]MBU4478040.1 zf-HC2 domain-containing protein [Candidatus Omnitrophota bacterium]MCG2704323.1 zf-HC2 domain-containing protein [Candidatus Omnitrophota bacterium]
MLTCWRLKRILYEYAMGEADASESKIIERHIAGCPGCSRKVQEIQLITESTAQEEKPFLSESFWRRFDERLSLRLSQEALATGEPLNLFQHILSFPRISVAVAVSVCLLLAAISIPLQNYLSTPSELALNEQGIVETALLMDQAGELNLGEDEDAYIDEFLLEMALEQV